MCLKNILLYFTNQKPFSTCILFISLSQDIYVNFYQPEFCTMDILLCEFVLSGTILINLIADLEAVTTRQCVLKPQGRSTECIVHQQLNPTCTPTQFCAYIRNLKDRTLTQNCWQEQLSEMSC